MTNKTLWVTEQADLRFSTLENGALDTGTALSRYREHALESAHFNDLPRVLFPEFHILSANKRTRNWTYYSSTAHKGHLDKSTEHGGLSTGQHSFTRPYPIPILEEHRAAAECGVTQSPVYGRIVRAKFIPENESRIGFMAGLGEMTHPQAIEEILTNRWLTNSLGSAVGHAECSICGHRFLSPDDQKEHAHQIRSYYRLNPKNKNALQDQDYEAVDSKEKGALPCMTKIESYMAREFSKVITPSDDQALVTIKDTSEDPTGHFGRRESADVLLWTPKAQSSAEGVHTWGARYIDLGSGREVTAESLGLLKGDALYEYVERLESGFVQTATFNETAESGRTLYAFSFQESGSHQEAPCSTCMAEAPCASCESGECLIHGENLISQTEKPLTTTGRKRLHDNVFCGPNRSFPVHDKAHYTAALRLLNRSNHSPDEKKRIRACVLRKGRKNGWTPKN